MPKRKRSITGNPEARRRRQLQQERRQNEDESTSTLRTSQNVESQQRHRQHESEEEATTRRSQDAQRQQETRARESIVEQEQRVRRDRIRRLHTPLYNVGRSCATSDLEEHACGTMDSVCSHCSGLYFPEEKNSIGRYRECCHYGKVVEVERMYPQVMRELITGNHPLSSRLFENVRSYNSSLSFASMGANVDSLGPGPPCFRIHGAIYHNTSHLHPPQSGQEKYAQLYILDSDQALRQRLNMVSSVTLDRDLLACLASTITNVNPFARAYKMLKEFEEETLREEGAECAANLRMYIKSEDLASDQHRGRYNAPRQNEVAVIFKSEDGVPPTNRDIVIHPRGGRELININTLNPNLEPMTYVLFFPHGDKGFPASQGLTELQFYSHRVSVRRDVFNPILYGRKLFQQYLVDAYVKVEGNRLSFFRYRQKQLRVESYMGLADHLYAAATEAGLRPGIPVILPSTFIGSPRNMQQNYQDAMAIVRDFGKPDLFITFTCNPKWKEITDNLFPGQKSYDRPDIVARVFDMKKKAFLQDLQKNHVLGVTVANIHVIEFQKRGLPHMHLLLILADEDKIRDADTVDAIVSAEIPDPDTDRLLFDVVKSSMIHGPCGELNRNCPCMVNGQCSKGFPKSFLEQTNVNINGYPQYRRRDDGRFVMVRDKALDNRWVVPYNPYLTKKYNAHINVEICTSVKSVKYLFKYVYKGHDAANVILQQEADGNLRWDEIRKFVNARYVSAPEAVWRLFEKNLCDKSHAVYRLAVHLEDMQPVYFLDDNERQALEEAARRKTMLTGWFELNRTTPEANAFFYVEIPKYFVWRDYAWHRRQRGGDSIIPRMYSVSPRDVERFHLRILLCHVKGAKSFEELRTFEGIVHPTFKDACRARRLLQDDQEWRNCLEEAAAFQMPYQVRQLFSFICVFSECAEPLALWEEFKECMSEDFARSHSLEDSFSLALRSIQEHLQVHNVSLSSFQLPEPAVVQDAVLNMPAYDAQSELQRAQELQAMLNPEQLSIYNAVMEAVQDLDSHRVKAFCVNAFAGAGKTFLFKTILHGVRGLGHVAVPVAWTGIAAILMDGGRTAHSTFKLPIPVMDGSTCRVKQDSQDGRKLKAAKLFIWDECTMTPHHALEAVDRLLRDLTGVDVPFGGKTVVLGGDWRQTLPVVAHGNRTSAIENCLKSSGLWSHFVQFTLTTNMRVRPEEEEFSEWLLKLGEGRLRNDSDLPDDIIEIPPACVSQCPIVEEVFGSQEFDFEDLASKAILCPKNEETLKLNEEILARFPGECVTYNSADAIVCEDMEESDTYQMDFVHSLTPSGMPPHRLNLKEGAVVMLLRNLDASRGLCNGTRLIVKKMLMNVIDCEVVHGQFEGSRVFIPRVQLSPSDSNLPFQLKRRQFPVRLAFAMTINKSQGQTLKKLGIHLPEPVFSHGMLYVAFSRCTSMSNIRVSVRERKKQGHLVENSSKVFTTNVVYTEVLQE